MMINYHSHRWKPQVGLESGYTLCLSEEKYNFAATEQCLCFHDVDIQTDWACCVVQHCLLKIWCTKICSRFHFPFILGNFTFSSKQQWVKSGGHYFCSTLDMIWATAKPSPHQWHYKLLRPIRINSLSGHGGNHTTVRARPNSIKWSDQD